MWRPAGLLDDYTVRTAGKSGLREKWRHRRGRIDPAGV